MQRLCVTVLAAVGLSSPISLARAQDAPSDWGLVEFHRDRGLTKGVIPGPADSAWIAVKALLKDVGLKPKTEDRTRGVFSNERQRAVRRLAKEPLSRLFSCGQNITGPNADTYHVYIRFEVVLIPKAAAQTRFELALYAEAIDVPGGRPERIACSTTGQLEYQLVGKLDERFPGTK